MYPGLPSAARPSPIRGTPLFPRKADDALAAGAMDEGSTCVRVDTAARPERAGLAAMGGAIALGVAWLLPLQSRASQLLHCARPHHYHFTGTIAG